MDDQVIIGKKTGNITVDLSKMVKSDDTMNSQYVTGGRMFFEASVSGDSVLSFVTNGFLDQMGYVEPQQTGKKLR